MQGAEEGTSWDWCRRADRPGGVRVRLRRCSATACATIALEIAAAAPLSTHLQLQMDVDGAVEAAGTAGAHAVLVYRRTRCLLGICAASDAEEVEGRKVEGGAAVGGDEAPRRRAEHGLPPALQGVGKRWRQRLRLPLLAQLLDFLQVAGGLNIKDSSRMDTT